MKSTLHTTPLKSVSFKTLSPKVILEFSKGTQCPHSKADRIANSCLSFEVNEIRQPFICSELLCALLIKSSPNSTSPFLKKLGEKKMCIYIQRSDPAMALGRGTVRTDIFKANRESTMYRSSGSSPKLILNHNGD